MGQRIGLSGIMARRSANTRLARISSVQRTACTPSVFSCHQSMTAILVSDTYLMTMSNGTPHTTTRMSNMRRKVSGAFHHPWGMISSSHALTLPSHWPIAANCCLRARIHSGSVAARICHRSIMTTASMGTANAHMPTHRANRIRLTFSRCLSSSSSSRWRSRSVSCPTCSAMLSRSRSRSPSSRARSDWSLASPDSSTASRSRIRLQRSSFSTQARSLFLISSSSFVVSLSSESCFLSVRFVDKSCRFVDRSF